MITTLLSLLVLVNGRVWWGSRPQWRNGAAMSAIYLDPAEKDITGSAFLDPIEQWGYAWWGNEARCDCQGLCGYGRGGTDHLVYGENKNARTVYTADPSFFNGDEIVYCYPHECKKGYKSVCKQSEIAYMGLSGGVVINHDHYDPDWRMCTCARIAAQWQRIVGDYSTMTIETGTSSYQEYTHAETNTRSVSITTSLEFGIEGKGMSMSSSVAVTEEFSTAVEKSYMKGNEDSHVVTTSCPDGKSNAFQYVFYMYDVLCAAKDPELRFLSTEIGGCAIASFISAEGITCTMSANEPPCCLPGNNVVDSMDRKRCTDLSTYTGQCNGYDMRVKSTSLHDRDSCSYDLSTCPNSQSSDLYDALDTCARTCRSNNARANTLNPTRVLALESAESNLLMCDSLSWVEDWLRKGFCQKITTSNHVVALVNRDCNSVVYHESSVSYDDAYQKAEGLAKDLILKNRGVYGSEEDFIPLYYNNFWGVCDGFMTDIGEKCANEGEVCTCHGEVKYGANGVFSEAHDVAGSIHCSHTVFGDPIVGTVKACYCKQTNQELSSDGVYAGCGAVGNNYGTEMMRVISGSPCTCKSMCTAAKDKGCASWTYIPDGLLGMGASDCVLRTTDGGLTDNCGGKCRSGLPDIDDAGIPDICGANGNNYGVTLKNVQVGSSCNCRMECAITSGCAAWTYVPDGLHGMGTNDCVLRSTDGGLVDNCSGKCRSGTMESAAKTCGSNGNNDGPLLRFDRTHSSCECAAECDSEPGCAAWTYIPDGLLGMGTDDCVLRSQNGGAVFNCGGKCLSGSSSRRNLKTAGLLDREEVCKCDDQCHRWGDCCDSCAKEQDRSHPGEFMTRKEMTMLGNSRSRMTEEEFKEANMVLNHY